MKAYEEIYQVLYDDIIDNWRISINEDIKLDSAVADLLSRLGSNELAYLAESALLTISGDIEALVNR